MQINTVTIYTNKYNLRKHAQAYGECDNSVSNGPDPETKMNRMTSVLEMTNGLFLIYDYEGTLKYVNRKLADLLGYSRDRLQGMHVTELVIKRHKRRIGEVLRSQLPQGKERTAEMPLRGRDGKELFVITRTAPIYDRQQVVAEVVLIEDITDRKSAETDLRESQRRVADIIESLPDAAVVIDQAGCILYWNREMVELTGFPASSMVGRDNYEHGQVLYNGYRRPMLVDLIVNPGLDLSNWYTNFRQEGDILITDNTLAFLKGEQKIMWGRAAPIYNNQGDVVGAVETIRDITERQHQEEELQRSHDKLKHILDSTVRALATTTEKRDRFTAGHQERVASLAGALAAEMGLSEELRDALIIAGTLHDIGKLYVPLDILSQTGKLTDIEFLFIKTHPAAGYDILKSIPFEEPIAEIVLQHHERLDGSGYPRGLRGKDILMLAKILAVADVVEAMVSHRPYRPAMGIEQAMQEIRGNSGKLYDADVVEACVRIFQNNSFNFNGKV